MPTDHRPVEEDALAHERIGRQQQRLLGVGKRGLCRRRRREGEAVWRLARRRRRILIISVVLLVELELGAAVPLLAPRRHVVGLLVGVRHGGLVRHVAEHEGEGLALGLRLELDQMVV